MRAYISSRRFHPGHFSHMHANYLMMQDLGFDPSLYVNEGFNSMAGDLKKINRFSQLLADKQFQYLMVWFPSIQSLLDMIFVRLFRRSVGIIYFFHEPYDSFANYLKSGFSFFKTMKICLVSVFNFFLVLLSSKVVLPSNAALKKYEANYAWLNKPYLRIPLLFDDESMGNIGDISKRPFISYVGTIADDHAFDEFVLLAARASENDLFPGLRFLIATRSVMPEWAMKRLASAISVGRVVVQAGHPLTNQEINQAYSSSVVVWNAYRRSMQSGVMPKAFMFGTPVLVSGLNESEFFINHECGELIPQYNYENTVLAISRIIDNFATYSKYSRESFLRNYFYQTHSQKFLEFISSFQESNA
jgi:glycosyltransferase involved in cell wall biosynthesis